TNDGDLAHRLTHASFGVTKTYDVVVKGRVSQEAIQTIRTRLGGPRQSSDQSNSADVGPRRVAKWGNASTVLSVVISESVPLEDVFLAQGCHVRRITRTAIGPLVLRGVAPGHWRELTRAEVQELKQAAGLRAPKRPTRSEGGPTKPRRRRE